MDMEKWNKRDRALDRAEKCLIPALAVLLIWYMVICTMALFA